MNPYRRAIAIIRERGWHQGTLSGLSGGVCVLGALLAAGHQQCYMDRRLRAAVALLCGPLPDRSSAWPMHPVARWNDAPERTIEDVVLALKHAAADWDAEHDAPQQHDPAPLQSRHRVEPGR